MGVRDVDVLKFGCKRCRGTARLHLGPPDALYFASLTTYETFDTIFHSCECKPCSIARDEGEKEPCFLYVCTRSMFAIKKN